MNYKQKSELTEVLRTKEKELEAALQFNKPVDEINKLCNEIKDITRKINQAYTQINTKVFPKYTKDEIRGARAAFANYRDQKSFDEDNSSVLSDNSNPSTPARGDMKPSLPALYLDKNLARDFAGILLESSTPAIKDEKSGHSKITNEQVENIRAFKRNRRR